MIVITFFIIVSGLSAGVYYTADSLANENYLLGIIWATLTILLLVSLIALLPDKKPTLVVTFPNEETRKAYRQKWCNSGADCIDETIYFEE